MSDRAKNSMAAVGSFDTVLPFQALGVQPFALDASSDVTSLINDLVRQAYGVIFVEEQVYLEHSSLFNRLNLEYDTSIIPIPGIQGSLGTGLEAVRHSVERAVGMDIFAEN